MNNMECTIDKFKFSLNDNGSISVYQKNSLTIVTTFYPAENIETQKDFDIECSDFYMKSLLY